MTALLLTLTLLAPQASPEERVAPRAPATEESATTSCDPEQPREAARRPPAGRDVVLPTTCDEDGNEDGDEAARPAGAPPRTLSALDDDDPGPRRPSSRDAPEEAEDDLGDEEPRVVSPPGPGKIRIDLQAAAGAFGGAMLGSAGGELRIGVVRPVALALGGEALFDEQGSAGWAARAALRVQGDLSPAPYLEAGVALLPGRRVGGLAGLGLAFPVTWRTGASVGARGLYTPEDGALGAVGVLALTFAP